MIVGTGPVAGAPVLVRLPRWVARPVMAGHMADDVTWAGEGPGHLICGRTAQLTSAPYYRADPYRLSYERGQQTVIVARCSGGSRHRIEQRCLPCIDLDLSIAFCATAIAACSHRRSMESGCLPSGISPVGSTLQDHHQIFAAWLRQDHRRRARRASVGCITTATGSLRAQRGKNVCANMRNECHLPQRISQPLEQAEHADEGWVHVHDTPDRTTR